MNLYHAPPSGALDRYKLVEFVGCRIVIEQLMDTNLRIDELIKTLVIRGLTERAAEYPIDLCSQSGMITLYFAENGSLDLYALLTRAGYEALRAYRANKTRTPTGALQ